MSYNNTQQYFLGDLYDISSGLSKSKDQFGSGYPFLSFKTVFNHTIIPTDLKDLAQTTLSEQNKYSILYGDVFLTRTSETANELGMSSVALKNYPQATFNGFTKRLRPKKGVMEIIDPKFIAYYLRTKDFRNQIDSISVLTTRASLNQGMIEKLTITVPNIKTQKKIAAILSALDEKIAINRAINENLERQAMALFKEWFIDNPDILSWQKGTFSKLIEKIISGDWGKETSSGSNTEMVYCIRGADIPEVRIGNKGKMPIRYILPKNFVSKQLVAGDIVVEISGGSPTQSTGRAAAISKALFARYDKGMVCTNFCKALKPIDGYSMFVYHYWQYLYDKGVFFSYENGTTGIKNLDINGFIETESIFIAPKEMVRKFDAACQSIFSKIYANGLENEELALLRDTLLPKLMSGELDVSGIDL